MKRQDISTVASFALCGLERGFVKVQSEKDNRGMDVKPFAVPTVSCFYPESVSLGCLSYLLVLDTKAEFSNYMEL